MAENSDKTITVVTTIHNGQRHWPGFFANLDAILGPNDSAIIVDDGSIPAVCLPQSLCGDPRFRLLSAGKIGRGAALNLAISQAETRFIAIQDVDDRSNPARLPVMKQLIARYANHLIFCEATCSDECDVVTTTPLTPVSAAATALAPATSMPRPVAATRLYRGNPLHHSGLVFPTALWRAAGGYDPSLPCCLDLDFYLRCLATSQNPLMLLSSALIWRNTGADRQYTRLAASLYHETVLTIRAKYRRQFNPPPGTYLCDLHHYARLLLNRIK
jgi:glycosyltransferase involved in cell wall biosynthesis